MTRTHPARCDSPVYVPRNDHFAPTRRRMRHSPRRPCHGTSCRRRRRDHPAADRGSPCRQTRTAPLPALGESSSTLGFDVVIVSPPPPPEAAPAPVPAPPRVAPEAIPTATSATQATPAPEAPAAPEIAPVHVSEGLQFVEAFAEPGAEEGAGARSACQGAVERLLADDRGRGDRPPGRRGSGGACRRSRYTRAFTDAARRF